MDAKKKSIALATALLTAVLPLATSPVATASPADDARNLAQQAFDWWAPRLMKSSPSFTLPGIQGNATVKWALAVTENADVMDAARQVDPEFAKKLDSPPKLSTLTKGVDKLTPAIADDGTLVTVLPFDKATIRGGEVTLHGLMAGALLQATEDKHSQVPIAAPDGAIQVLYDIATGSGHKTSGLDMVNALKPAVTISKSELSYNNGKKDGLPYLPITNLNITPITPGAMNTLEQVVDIVNNRDGDLRSIVEVLTTAGGGKSDDKGGLVPVLGSDGKPIRDTKKVGDGRSTVKHDLAFKSPRESEQVYVNHRVVDDKGRDVVQPSMRTMSALKPTLDVQASSQEGSRKLAGQERQMIYNQAKISQLTPGKPYQVLVNLSQCNPTDGCTEVAAVNREIIPRDTTERTENFSVDIDATNIEPDNTFEWTTSVFEGTGDIHKMGDKLVAVDDHPSSQVLSFDGKGESLNKGGAGETTTHHAGGDEGLEIGNEAPPSSMEQVRENNARLDAGEDETLSLWTALGIGFGIAGLLAVLVGGYWFYLRRATATAKSEES